MKRRIALAALVAAALVSGAVQAEPRPIHEGVAGPFSPAERREQVQINPPPPETWTPGDCDSVADVFRARGATADEVAFFIGRGILWRETRCGQDTHNESTGDSGICQINPVHQRAGYFWGREYPAGGWLGQFDVRTRHDTDSPKWVDACLFLYRNEGSDPWRATR